MSASSPRASSARRRRPSWKPVFSLALTLVTAAGIAVGVYLAITSLPFLISSPTTDPFFGELNQCLIDGLSEPRVGFAVSVEGRKVAGYGGTRVLVCGRTEGRAQRLSEFRLPSVNSAAFDFEGTLWLATQSAEGREAELWRLGPEEGRGLERVGTLAPILLVGHERGVAALEASGRLVSLSSDGEVTGLASLRAAPTEHAQLAVNVDGTLVSVVAGTGLFVFRARSLAPVLGEGPCAVEHAWWSTEPARALVQCGPAGSWALELLVPTGEAETAPKRARGRSVLVPRAGVYVTSCDNLPCSAPAP